MAGKRFEAKVLKLRPEFAVKDRYFYYRTTGPIVCGFVWERAPRMARARRFALPLYERVRFLNLSFSERLRSPNDLMVRFNSDAEEAEEFIHRITPYEEETRTWQNPETFLTHFEDARTLESPFVRRSIAWTYVLLGRPAEARAHLNLVLGVEGLESHPYFFEEVRSMLRVLDEGLDNARKLLLVWEAETKRQFQIESNATSAS